MKNYKNLFQAGLVVTQTFTTESLGHPAAKESHSGGDACWRQRQIRMGSGKL